MTGVVPARNDTTASTPHRHRRLTQADRLRAHVPERLRFPLAMFAVLELPLLIWWLAFYPGLGNYDSVQYSWEVLTAHWSTDHSLLYDAFVWLSFQISGGLALLTFVQTLAIAGVLAFAATSLVRLGVRRRWAAAAAVACTLVPSLGSFSIYVWKDVAFAAAEVWARAWTMQLLQTRRDVGEGWSRTPQARRQFIWLFVALLAVALFRNNGFLVVVVDGAILAALMAGGRRLAAAAAAAAVAVFMALTYGLFPNVGVKPAPSDLVLGPAYDDIAVVYHSYPESFTASQLRLMKQVSTKKIWDGGGQYCWNADRLTLTYHWRPERAAAHSGALFRLWLSKLKHYPLKVLSARWCRGSIAWSPVPPWDKRGASIFPNLDVPANMFGWWPTKLAQHPEIHHAFQADPPIPSLRSAAKSYVSTSMGVGGEWILWRGATWCYLAYIAVGVLAWRRRSWIWVTVAGVALANQLTVLVDNPAQLIRYMEGCIYLGILALPLLTLSRRQAREPVTSGPAPADEQ